MKTRSKERARGGSGDQHPKADLSLSHSLKRKPKKPPTAFFFYLEDFRKEFQHHNPAVKSMRQIGKACGQKWKTLSFEEKVAYYDIATEKRAEFERAMTDYIKRKENGELSDNSEDEL